MCFTVVEQSSRYKAKNVIDTVVYRFGDVTSAWIQTGLRAAGVGVAGAVALGIGACIAWGGVASYAGRQYEQLRGQQR
jgi:AAA family ATP:ADP antiporter